MQIIKRILNSFVFWGAWIIIPIVMEIIPSLGSLFLLLKRRYRTERQKEKPTIYPEISIIIPVYNSEDTLFECISSVYNSTYPNKCIRIFLVNNQGKDDSFSVFAECQRIFPGLRMQWLNAEQGKSRALNLALYNSEGKYIVNLDSDGTLEPNALTNLIDKFEANPDLNCMTGTVLTDIEQIKSQKRFFSRLLRNLEFMEYAQAFLAGRSYASEMNAVYTLSGAFSAFRKSAILKSWMYNTDTITEDTHLTFQMRYQQKERVEVCENAIFFTNPIDDVNKLYTQRQRWQRGSLEVAKMFMDDKFKVRNAFKDVNVKSLLYDHTFAFPRMIWYLALLCLVYLNYSAKALLYSTAAIFGLYIIIGFLYFILSAFLMKMDKKLQRYYLQHWWCILLMPFYNLSTFVLRLFGIVNSIKTTSAWKTKNLTEEKDSFLKTLKEDTAKTRGVFDKVRGFINKSVQPAKETKKKKSANTAAWYFSVALLYVLSVFVIFLVYWSRKTFGVGIGEIFNTLMGNIQGTGGGMMREVISGFVIPIMCVTALIVLVIVGDWLIGRFGKKGKLYRFIQGCAVTCGIALLATGMLYANAEYRLLDAYASSSTVSTIYEELYVDPADVAITAEGKTKNLIFIYVESLETTYASAEDGGVQLLNFMPNLTQLAKEGINFADVNNMGGAHTLSGNGFTMAALLSGTSGVPYALPADNESGEYLFMPGLTNLGDILEEKGYTQEFLCGSDINFARRGEYFTQHGNYRIFDVFTAMEKGYISHDYWHNWGFEDKILFDIARDEINALAAEGKPFNFTMLTVDLHTPTGYICEWCDEKYPDQTANVIDCNDREILDFIRWCQKQAFYEDTVIIMTGDHPRMDSCLVQDVPYYDRTVYNCFLNSAVESQRDIKSRTFTMLDMFPTTLAAMGFEIEGEQLGFGVNLFSRERTLSESRGFDWLEGEFKKSSNFYLAKFAPHLVGQKMQTDAQMEG